MVERLHGCRVITQLLRRHAQSAIDHSMVILRQMQIPNQLADIEAAGKRMADPLEIAKLAVYLASDDSAYVVGADFLIDGGVTAISAV